MHTRTVFAAAVAVLLLISTSVWVVAQGPPVSSLSLISSTANPVPGMGAALTGFQGTGPSLFYWVVARYPGGISLPQGPAQINNTPGAANLSATRFVTVTWMSAPGATGYDVLRGTSQTFPASPSCAACAVVLNTTALSAVDNNVVPLGAYPPAGIPSAQAQVVTFQADSVNFPSTMVRVGFPGSSRFLPTLTAIPVAGQAPIFGPNGTLVSSATTGFQQTSEKNQPNGYAGLTAATKLFLAQGQEVWALADLSDVASKVGNSTAVQMAGAGAPALDDCAKFDANGNIVTVGAPCGTLPLLAGNAGRFLQTDAATTSWQFPVASGTVAARPAAAPANTGVVYLPTNSSMAFRSDGTTWQGIWPMYRMTPPVSTDYAWVNQTLATVADTQGYPTMTSPTELTNPNWHLQVRALPAASNYTITWALMPGAWGDFSGLSFAAALRDSVGGGIVVFQIMYGDNRLAVSNYTSPTVLSGHAIIIAEINMYGANPYWFRVVDDGANRIWQTSRDGQTWRVFFTVARTNFITPNQFGWGINSNNTGWTSTLNALSIVTSTP